jgi:L-malate glycosyltransferase
MNILLCCEHFYPSVGGVQKMMYELGMRFVMHGHQVTVATSWRADRTIDVIDGIKIVGFKVTGNAAFGMRGEYENYQQFLVDEDFDFLLVMAAQQWTFDAMLPILDLIDYKKLHIPCGYSGFYLSHYKTYFAEMAQHLRKFDALIYNASNYRDIEFARSNNLSNIHLIPAGASELEFSTPHNATTDIRAQLDIPSDDFIYLSIGAPAYGKGHKEILKAYLCAKIPFSSTLVLNGNYSNIPSVSIGALFSCPRDTLKEIVKRIIGRSPANIKRLAASVNKQEKRVILTDQPRESLIQLYFEADLFLFASHVEYSPLVIFECLAAGLPFLSIPVGNVEEIADWTGGGVICPGTISSKGFSSADPAVFGSHIRDLSLDRNRLQEIGSNGRKAWFERFTWEKIAAQIEQLTT